MAYYHSRFKLAASGFQNIHFKFQNARMARSKHYVSTALLSYLRDQTDLVGFERHLFLAHYKVISIFKSKVNIGGRNSQTK